MTISFMDDDIRKNGLGTGVILPAGVSWFGIADRECKVDLATSIVTCALGSMTAGAQTTVSYQATAQTPQDLLTNPITVSGNEADSIVSNNTTAPAAGGGDETPLIVISSPTPGGGNTGGHGGGVLGPVFMVLMLMVRLLNRIVGFNGPRRAPGGGTTPPG